MGCNYKLTKDFFGIAAMWPQFGQKRWRPGRKNVEIATPFLNDQSNIPNKHHVRRPIFKMTKLKVLME